MTPIEIYYDRGHGEKTLVLTPHLIGAGDENDVLNCKPDLVVFAGNGADYAAPPFDKGAPVLRSIRSASSKSCDIWKLLLPLADSDISFLRLLPSGVKTEANWGIWICESEDFPNFPHLMLVNFPIWAARCILEKSESEGVALLSKYYRAILGAVDLFRACRLIPVRTVAMSDIGGNMLKTSGNGLQKNRITVLGEVVGAWLSMCASTEKIIVSFDGNSLSEAWKEYAAQSRDDEAEYGDAKELRKQNAKLCLRLAERIGRSTSLRESLATRLKENAKHFDSETMTLLTDLLQSRALAEAVVKCFLELHGKGEKHDFDFVKMIDSMDGVSLWIKSYLHTLRILGNEGAHTKDPTKRRPEQPSGRDLVVIHAALNRILNFACDEFK